MTKTGSCFWATLTLSFDRAVLWRDWISVASSYSGYDDAVSSPEMDNPSVLPCKYTVKLSQALYTNSRSEPMLQIIHVGIT